MTLNEVFLFLIKWVDSPCSLGASASESFLSNISDTMTQPRQTVSPLTRVAFGLTMSNNNPAWGHVGGRPGLLQHWLFVFARAWNPQRDSAGESCCGPAVRWTRWSQRVIFHLLLSQVYLWWKIKHGWLAAQAGGELVQQVDKEGRNTKPNIQKQDTPHLFCKGA